MNSTRRRSLFFLVTLGLVVAMGTWTLQASAGDGAQEQKSLVEVTVPNQATVERLQPLYGLTEWTRDNPDGTVTINVEATPAELAELRARGYEIGATIENYDTWLERKAERAAAIAAENRSQALAEEGRSSSSRSSPSAAAADVDTVTMARSDYFKNYAGAFLSVEAKSSSGSGTTLSASYDTGSGFGSATTMTAFVDDGVYLYHRVLIRVGPSTYTGPAPITARVGSSAGGVGTLTVKAWPGPGLPPFADGYLQGFFTHYMDPTEVYARIDGLAAEFPNIAEIVNLPYKTGGYQRKSMCVMAGTTACNGSPTDASGAVYLETKAYGQDGGNSVQAEFVNPIPPPLTPTVSVSGTRITVQLGVGSTAAQVRDAINADPAASALVTAYTYAGNLGTGVVQARALVNLSDFLSAPASVQRGPFQLRALRIGKVRDGSKIGVFLFCQQHAREWVTPLTCVETAERLLRNYATDPATKELVDNLDIFILPSYNPDGSHYSMYDFASQRKNMTRYCALTTTTGMPTSRNTWGVDNNRNNSIGSIFDGYAGASTDCTSEVYAGPSEVSEPENRDERWLVDTFSNIRFSNNIHTYGGYFMWAPGAYVLSGRQTLPHANIGVEGYFFDAARTVLGRIEQYRDTTVLPGRTGPIADVLYSAAGNSADDQYYRKGIIGYSFEAGSDRFTSNSSGTSQTAVGFMPSYATEGAPEAMEFAWGNYGLLEEALKYANDTTPPDSQMMPNGGASTTPIVSTFEWVSEAAVIHYTLDGSAPTLDSPTWNAQSPTTGRLPGEFLTFTAPKTTVKWIAQDIRGNVSDVKSATFYVDTTSPVTTASLAPPAVNGWHSNPTLTLSGDDGADGSGVASTTYSLDGGTFTAYTSSIPLSGDGDHTLSFRSTDAAGNAEATQLLSFKIDGTVPATTADVSPDAVNGWYANPTVTLSAADATSGVDRSEYRLDRGEWTTYSGPFRVLGDGNRTLEYRSVDQAGNLEAATSVGIRIDATPPVTTPTLSPAAVNGWYANPTVSLAADDGPGSGVERSAYRFDGGDWTTYSGAFHVTGDGSHTLEFSSTDVAGNVEAVSSVIIANDVTPPTITIASPPNGGSFTKGSVVAASYNCTDATSGVESCTGGVTNGQPIDTSSVGSHAFTVVVRDRAGNAQTQLVTYTVVFSFAGFFQPVDNPPTLNVVKAGSGVPVKFGLGGNQGLAIFAGGYPQSELIACDKQAPTSPIGAKDTLRISSSSLSYDRNTNQYTYAWATNKSWQSTCRRLSLKLTDDTVHSALFKFTR